jgi:hypothetical protein
VFALKTSGLRQIDGPMAFGSRPFDKGHWPHRATPRLIGEARARSAAVAPTAAATDRFLARLGTAFPGTVWVGGCKNWYTSQQPTPVLWPFPQSEHKAFFEQVPVDDFQFIPSGQGSIRQAHCRRAQPAAGFRASAF